MARHLESQAVVVLAALRVDRPTVPPGKSEKLKETVKFKLYQCFVES